MTFDIIFERQKIDRWRAREFVRQEEKEIQELGLDEKHDIQLFA